jgi:hypothetical protein
MVLTFQQMVHITTNKYALKVQITTQAVLFIQNSSQISIRASIILATKLETKEPDEKRIYMLI